MKEENAIEVRNLHKKFKVYLDKGSELKERLLFHNRNRYEERWVLNGISFDVKKGEAIGLIGHNGCGKSTTLKLLTRILYPDQGTVEMKGRVSSLIELGAGFHPDMSGRENIYTNASIFGLSKKEIDARMDDIIAFSELEEFLDNPVRTYSSGMYMRLAFSVAINVDADILLIDEILAVGDISFQQKCFNYLRELKNKGMTIVLVSHSLGQIEQLCDKSIWLHDGKIVAMGNTYDIHAKYLKFMEERRQNVLSKEKAREENKEKKNEEKDNNKAKGEDSDIINNVQDSNRWGKGDAIFTDVKILDSNGKEKEIFETGEKAVIQLHYKVKKKIENAVIGFSFTRTDGVYCYGTNTEIERLDKFALNEDGAVEIVLENLEFLPNVYYLDLEIKNIEGETMDFYKKAAKIEIYTTISDVGVCRLEHSWRMKEQS